MINKRHHMKSSFSTRQLSPWYSGKMFASQSGSPGSPPCRATAKILLLFSLPARHDVCGNYIKITTRLLKYCIEQLSWYATKHVTSIEFIHNCFINVHYDVCYHVYMLLYLLIVGLFVIN